MGYKEKFLDRAMRNLIAVRTGSEYSPRPDEKDASESADNATTVEGNGTSTFP